MTRKIVILFFVLNLFLLQPIFFPNLADLNAWDEAAYVNSGRELLDRGNLPDFAGNPLMSLFYALTYLPFHNSPFWLVQSDSLGRIFLFALLWLSAYLVAKEVSRFFSPALPTDLLMVGMILVTPLAAQMLRFPSDPMFASLAGLSLWQLLAYHRTSLVKHLWLASVFIGLAALARNDGLVAWAVLLVLVILLGIQSKSWRIAGRAVVATIIPFALFIGGYVLFYGIRTGHFELGTAERTYINFEVGQQAIFSGTGQLDLTTEARLEARRSFGTPEENNYSVFKAIQRNPRVYLQRLVATVKALPENLLRAYGIRFAPILFLLALRGLIELVRQKRYTLLVLLCLWAAPLLTGFIITLFRSGHLLLPFYVLFVLASIGLIALLRGLGNRREAYAWLAVLLALVIYGLVGNKLAIYYSAAVLLAALAIIYILIKPTPTATNGLAVSLLILLSAGLILRGELPSPKIRTFNQTPDEQSAVYLANLLEPGTLVAAGTPAPVWMAKMEFANIIAPDVPIHDTPSEFLDWLRIQDIRAVYVDQSLYSTNPGLWALLEAEIGSGLEQVHTNDNGNIQILLVR